MPYMLVYEFGCWLSFTPRRWSAQRSMPIWFSVKDPDWKPAAKAREEFAKLKMEDPPRLISIEDHVAVPIYLPCGVEWDQVLDAVLAQVREIARLLA